MGRYGTHACAWAEVLPERHLLGQHEAVNPRFREESPVSACYPARSAQPSSFVATHTEPMITRPLGKQDYDHIVQIIDRWWGGPTTALAHPIFFYELGSMARVVEHDGILVGFLLGFVAPGPPKTGYVHLVGIHPDYRRRGVGKVLYQTFEEDSRAAGCTRLKAITTTGNEGSIAFHRATGWSVSNIEDYAGPARPRVVFHKNL